MTTPQRPDWSSEPKELGHLFRVHMDRCGRQVEAVCRLVSHPLGWEVRLDLNGDPRRSEVCRSHDEVLATGDRWRAALIDKGWQ